MLNTLFQGIFQPVEQSAPDIAAFILCLLFALALGCIFALCYRFKNQTSFSFLGALALLPMVVCVVILMVNGKISVKDDRITVICGAVISENEFERQVKNMKLCIKAASSEAFISPQLTGICEKYKGDTAVCFYLTDLKKTVMPRAKISLKVNKESFEELKSLYDISKIGLI